MTTSDFVLSRASFRYTAQFEGLGVPILELDGFTGGEGAAQITSTRQGTSLDETQVLGTPPTYSDVTFIVLLSQSHDGWNLYRKLEGKQGSQIITVHRQPLDGNRDPFGDSQVRTVTMSTLAISDYDKDSGDPAEITITATGGKWR